LKITAVDSSTDLPLVVDLMS